MKFMVTIIFLILTMACGGNVPQPQPINSEPAPIVTPASVETPPITAQMVAIGGGADLSKELNMAIAAYAGQTVTFKASAGNFDAGWQLKSGQSLYLTAGRYTSTVNIPDGIQFYLESGSTVYGDGIDKTILQESSKGGRNTRMFGPSGFQGEPAFAGYNEKINVHDFTIEGHPSEVFYDNGPTTIQLGNCTDCHAVRVKLKDTHAYGIYVGGFHTLGYTAKDSSIEYCEFDHVIAQNTGALNGINISIVHNKFWNLGKLATDPLSNAVDIEPNIQDEITENITVCDNDAKGAGGQYWNAYIIQIGGSSHPIKGGEVCRNTATGPGLLNGLMIAGTQNLNVHDNRIETALQSGAYLINNQALNFQNNIFLNVAPGGIYGIRVEATTNSKFTNNSITKTEVGYDDRFIEIGTSGGNVYSGNKRGDVVLLNGSTEVNHKAADATAVAPKATPKKRK